VASSLRVLVSCPNRRLAAQSPLPIVIAGSGSTPSPAYPHDLATDRLANWDFYVKLAAIAVAIVPRRGAAVQRRRGAG
jgi:hypothetical protein